MDELGSRNWLTKEEATAFIGKNTEYYLDNWKSHPDTFYKGWNWAAAAFRVEWMAYRKMYLESVLVLVAVILLGFAVDAIFSVVRISTPDGFSRFAVQILIGFIGNGLYRMKAVRILLRTDKMNALQRLSYLEKKGGTSLIGLFVLLGLEILIVFLPIAIASLIS